MKYRRLDENHDYTLGRNEFLTDQAACAQAVLTRLKLLLTEWWEDTTDGLPLWQQILGVYGVRKEQIDRLYIERITGTQGVTGIQSFSSNLVNRAYSFSASVNTVYGTLSVSGGNA